MRVDELGGVHQIAAIIALVATGALVTANVARAFNIAVWQEALFSRAIQELLAFFIEIATF